MPCLDIVKESLIHNSARVMQVQGLFDVPRAERITESWHVDFSLPEDWNIGVIVGPSGCGKTTLCREVYGDAMPLPFLWRDGHSILDDFPSTMGIKDIVDLLSSVGFSSPPSWLKPYAVLSNGEQFRVTLARHLSEMASLCVIDEFSSVIDRQVAQVCSLAFQKAVRRRKQRVILATCHYDVLQWLEPDWTYEPHLVRYTPGRHLRRPALTLTISRVEYALWHHFKKYHYLSAELNHAAKCFGGFIDGTPVVFQAWLHHPHAQRIPMKRITRTVVHPDFQGVGIGQKMTDYMSSVVRAIGYRVVTTTGHPARRAALGRSPLWRRTRSATMQEKRKSHLPTAFGRFTEGFEYVGEKAARDESRALWESD